MLENELRLFRIRFKHIQICYKNATRMVHSVAASESLQRPCLKSSCFYCNGASPVRGVQKHIFFYEVAAFLVY